MKLIYFARLIFSWPALGAASLVGFNSSPVNNSSPVISSSPVIYQWPILINSGSLINMGHTGSFWSVVCFSETRRFVLLLVGLTDIFQVSFLFGFSSVCCFSVVIFGCHFSTFKFFLPPILTHFIWWHYTLSSHHSAS